MARRRAHDTTTPTAVEIENDRGSIQAVADRIVTAAASAGYSEASRFAVRLAVEEAIVNAFRHGHRALEKDAPVLVEFEVSPAVIRVAVQDRGPGFSPDEVPDPTAPENITKTSGRGLLLIRAYMSEVTHNLAGNRIEMRYRRPDPTTLGR
jgi:serine/threonine-protein kinase RsbW